MKTFSPIDSSLEKFCKEDTETSIVKRFEQQVVKFPHHHAVKTKSNEITYTDLNRMANRIGRVVRSKGTKDAETVALLFKPGISMIAAILGVLKAGKIWVSLDTTNPIDRITYILNDSQAKIILSNHKTLFKANSLLKKSII